MPSIQGNFNENRDFMMRPSPNNRRMRGRGNGGRRSGPSSSQHFDSNGPDLKVRGNASQIVDKYQTLAREATTAGDPVMAENYYQHAEHYLRILSANAESRPENGSQDNNRGDTQAASNQEHDYRQDGDTGDDRTDLSAESSRENDVQQAAESLPGTDQPQAESSGREKPDTDAVAYEPPAASLNPADIAARASRPRRRRPRPEPTETGDAVS